MTSGLTVGGSSFFTRVPASPPPAQPPLTWGGCLLGQVKWAGTGTGSGAEMEGGAGALEVDDQGEKEGRVCVPLGDSGRDRDGDECLSASDELVSERPLGRTWSSPVTPSLLYLWGSSSIPAAVPRLWLQWGLLLLGAPRFRGLGKSSLHPSPGPSLEEG